MTTTPQHGREGDNKEAGSRPQTSELSASHTTGDVDKREELDADLARGRRSAREAGRSFVRNLSTGAVIAIGKHVADKTIEYLEHQISGHA